MPKLLLTHKQQAFIKRNRFKMSGSDMARKFGVEKNIVTQYMRKRGLTVPKEYVLKFRAAAIQKRYNNVKHPADKIIKAEYMTTPIKTLAKKIKRSDTYVRGRLEKLGLIIPPEITVQRILDNRRKPGDVPVNKGKKQTEFMSLEMIERTKATRFKKGQIPHNAIGFKDGDVVIRNSHKERNQPPYKWIRISRGKWRMYHVVMWEQENGPVPEGCIIVFKDKNTMNVVSENLECITKEENMRRNTLHRYPEDIKQSIQLLSVLTRKINKHEKQNK